MTAVTVHELPVILDAGLEVHVELRFTEPDDFNETGYRSWSMYLTRNLAAQVGAKLMQVGLGLETEDQLGDDR